MEIKDWKKILPKVHFWYSNTGIIALSVPLLVCVVLFKTAVDFSVSAEGSKWCFLEKDHGAEESEMRQESEGSGSGLDF